MYIEVRIIFEAVSSIMLVILILYVVCRLSIKYYKHKRREANAPRGRESLNPTEEHVEELTEDIAQPNLLQR